MRLWAGWQEGDGRKVLAESDNVTHEQATFTAATASTSPDAPSRSYFGGPEVPPSLAKQQVVSVERVFLFSTLHDVQMKANADTDAKTNAIGSTINTVLEELFDTVELARGPAVARVEKSDTWRGQRRRGSGGMASVGEALINACFNGQAREVRRLLSGGADANIHHIRKYCTNSKTSSRPNEWTKPVPSSPSRPM